MPPMKSAPLRLRPLMKPAVARQPKAMFHGVNISPSETEEGFTPVYWRRIHGAGKASGVNHFHPPVKSAPLVTASISPSETEEGFTRQAR